MEIRLSEVRKVFNDVLLGRLSREAADRWAYSVIKKSEEEELVFSPPEDREKIWTGIMYLYGIDIRESPDEYLHTLDDIRAALRDKLGDKSD